MEPKFLFFLLLSFTFLSACEMTKEIDYDTQNYTPKLIIHGYISHQDGVQVIIKKTTSPGNVNDDDIVNNAEVLLYNNDRDCLKLKQVNDYMFISDSVEFIDKNKQYYIRAKADNFEQISSEKQKILSTPQIDSVKIRDKNQDNLILYFNNNYTEAQMFYINVFPYFDGKIGVIYAKDEKFNPFSMLDNIIVGSNMVDLDYVQFFEYDSLLLELHVLSSDLVQFLDSQDNYDFSKEDPFYPQPYPVYSNINGGYGIFASHSYSSIIINESRRNGFY